MYKCIPELEEQQKVILSENGWLSAIEIFLKKMGPVSTVLQSGMVDYCDTTLNDEVKKYLDMKNKAYKISSKCYNLNNIPRRRPKRSYAPTVQATGFE